MKIEFGCGETPRTKGFKTCDIRDLPGIDFVCDAWEIDTIVEPNSVEHIYSRHFFEHLTFAQGLKFAEVCSRILKPGGCFEMLLPNFEFAVAQWLTEENVMDFNVPNPFERGMEGLWGKQRGGLDELWDTHKAGYKKWQLEKIFADLNFSKIGWAPSMVKEHHMVAFK